MKQTHLSLRFSWFHWKLTWVQIVIVFCPPRWSSKGKVENKQSDFLQHYLPQMFNFIVQCSPLEVYLARQKIMNICYQVIESWLYGFVEFEFFFLFFFCRMMRKVTRAWNKKRKKRNLLKVPRKTPKKKRFVALLAIRRSSWNAFVCSKITCRRKEFFVFW